MITRSFYSRDRQVIGVTSEVGEDGGREGVQERERRKEIKRSVSQYVSSVYLPGRSRLAPKVHAEPTKHCVGRISLSLLSPHKAGVAIYFPH